MLVFEGREQEVVLGENRTVFLPQQTLLGKSLKLRKDAFLNGTLLGFLRISFHLGTHLFNFSWAQRRSEGATPEIRLGLTTLRWYNSGLQGSSWLHVHT